MQILLIMFADFMPFKPPDLAALLHLSEFDMLMNNNNNNNNNNCQLSNLQH